MASVTPWLSFQSAQDAGPAGSGAPWFNVNGALSIGGQEASSGPIGFISAEGSDTTLLRISQPSLAGQIAIPFLLLGVELEVRGRWTGATDGTRAANVQSVVDAAVRQNLGSCSLPISGSPGTCLKGSPTNTLGFTEADVTLAGFGFQLQGSSTTFNTQGNTLFLDSLRVRIHWDEPPAARLRGRVRGAFTRSFMA